MSYWISEDSTAEDLESIIEILNNLTSFLDGYDEAQKEEGWMIEQYPPSKYFPAVEKFLVECRAVCDDIEASLAKVKELYH